MEIRVPAGEKLSVSSRSVGSVQPILVGKQAWLDGYGVAEIEKRRGRMSPQGEEESFSGEPSRQLPEPSPIVPKVIRSASRMVQIHRPNNSGSITRSESAKRSRQS